MFLTISIPTYNRSKHLYKLLESLLSIINNSSQKNRIGVFVSNNASTDDTIDTLSYFSEKYSALGLEFNFNTLSRNMGSGVNVLETLKRPKSKYIWWFSDDDEVLPDFMERLLFELDEHKPNVCNVGFLQSPYTEKTPRYGRDIHGFYSDIHTIHEVMSTKLSSIIVKKNGFTFPSEKEVLKSLWPQVLIILPLILTTKSYYIFSCNMAGSDSNYLDIRYPPSAFYDLIVIKRDIYRKYNIEQIFKSKRKEVTRFAVNIHFLLLIMTRKASPTNEVKKNIHSELLYDFFSKFGCLNMVNYRSLASFLVKYAQYRAGLIYKKIINIFALNYYKK
jgi:glycosyltransferase involved in cell wall biosynthesis